MSEIPQHSFCIPMDKKLGKNCTVVIQMYSRTFNLTPYYCTNLSLLHSTAGTSGITLTKQPGGNYILCTDGNSMDFLLTPVGK